MNEQNSGAFMPDEDLMNTILCDMKRTVREYATAATESACPTVRRTFNDLTMDALRLQGDLYTHMSQLNMYPAPAKALRQDVDKQLQTAQQMQQKTGQFVQQKTGQSGSFAHIPNAHIHANAHNQPSHLM
jgi:spore coat protein F